MTEKLKIYGKKFVLIFIVAPAILWMLLSAGVAIAKYVTQKNVTSGLNVSITVANGYTISSSKLQTALKTLKSSSPTTLKFVTGDSSELTGLTCISAASSGVQADGSDKIGVFQSNDGKTIYVAPMNADGTPADNDETMATPVDSSYLLDATKTGLTTLTSISCANLDTSNTTDMSYMFNKNSKLTNLDVSSFDTLNNQNFAYMFSECSSLTSLDVTNFDTSSATTMDSMFNACSSLTSLDVTNFNTSNVTNFEAMFGACRSLTTLDVTNFDTSSAQSMYYMFGYCKALTTLDLSSFNTSRVTDMTYMFNSCTSLERIYASDAFVTNNVTSSDDMFTNCTSLVGGAGTAYDSSHIDKEYAHIDGGTSNPGYFYNPPTCTISSSALQTALKTLSSSSPTTLKFVTGNSSELTGLTCVSGASSGVQADGSDKIGVFQSNDGKTIYVAPMNDDGTPAKNNATMAAPVNSSYLLSSSKTGLSALTSISCTNFDTSNVTDMSYMFYNNSKLTNLDVSGFDTSKVENFSNMFNSCKSLTTLDVSNFDTSSATDMQYMFSQCNALPSLDVSNFDTSKVTTFNSMFDRCNSLTTLDVTKFDTSSANSMFFMFSACSSLTSLDVSNFDTSSVATMQSMFYGCSALTTLDLSSFNTSKVSSMKFMFGSCTSLERIYASENFVTDQVTLSSNMFTGDTKLVGGAGTTYSSSHIEKEYARIDGGPSSTTPGYFTGSTSSANSISVASIIDEAVEAEQAGENEVSESSEINLDSSSSESGANIDESTDSLLKNEDSNESSSSDSDISSGVYSSLVALKESVVG